MKLLLEKIIIGLVAFPFIVGFLILISPLAFVVEVLEFYRKIFREL